jgi:uncharacterized protein
MNSITHFELPAKDVQRSKKFYEDVFGWKMQSMPEANYTMVYTVDVDEKFMPKNVGAINGGMIEAKDNGGLNPVLVIDVPNIDEYLTKVVAAGGKIVQQKGPVMGMGYYARFEDPEGVVMGIWESIRKA